MSAFKWGWLALGMMTALAARADAEPREMTGLGSQENPRIIDLAGPALDEKVQAGDGYAYVRIINMAPKHRKTNAYKLVVRQSSSLPAPFSFPGHLPNVPNTLSSGAARILGVTEGASPTLISSCKALQDGYSALEATADETAVPDLVSAIEAGILAYGDTYRNESADKVISDAAASAEDKAAAATFKTQDKERCDKAVANARKLVAGTQDFIKVTHSREGETMISVSRKETGSHSLTFTGDDSGWLTHVGFSFYKDKSKKYYSRDTGGGTFEVARQHDNHDYSYMATVLFTYPLHSWDNGLEFGLSPGLAASSDTIAALLGLSLVIQKNFVISGGAVYSKVDVLNGTYSEGQSLSQAVDSSALRDTTFKPSFQLTFGYRIGK